MPADRPTTLRLTLADGSARLWPLEALRRLPDQAVRGEMVLTLAHEPLARLRVVGRGPIAE
ncbi:MAG TPA: hypothetical protein ENK83_03470, partial [Aliiroseovarius sp.]|nr:hypothetical protein [Aliiroseovarius sp.]